MSGHREVVFESEICEHLAAHGWLYSPDDAGYDRERALFPGDVFAWMEETQQAALGKALRAAGSQGKFLDVLVAALDRPLEHGGGTLNILRSGAVHRWGPPEDGAVPSRDEPERDHERAVWVDAAPGDAAGSFLHG